MKRLWFCLIAGIACLILFDYGTPLYGAEDNPHESPMDASARPTVELVTVLSTLIVAIFGLITSAKAKEIALRAEKASGRSEQFQLRATAAGEVLLGAMAELMVAAETILFTLSTRAEKSFTAEETRQYLVPIAKAAGETKKTLYSTALYTTHAVRESLNELLRPIQKAEIDFSMWQSFVLDLRAQHSEIAALFRETYLK